MVESTSGYKGQPGIRFEKEYDQFGHIKRMAEFHFPDNNLESETLSFCSAPGKLDSIKSFCCRQYGRYNTIINTYDNKGLLVEDEFHDIRRNNVVINTYEYK